MTSSDFLVYLANAALPGASPRVVDVVILLADSSLVAGYPSKVSLGQSSGLVLTAQGAIPGLGDDAIVDMENFVWGWTTTDDGSQSTFGTDGEELAKILSDALIETYVNDDSDGEESARLDMALGVVAHARRDLKTADMHYRSAMKKLALRDDWGATGNGWMRLVALYVDMGEAELARSAAAQAVSCYTAALGEDHSRVAHARGVLERIARNFSRAST